MNVWVNCRDRLTGEDKSQHGRVVSWYPESKHSKAGAIVLLEDGTFQEASLRYLTFRSDEAAA